jgi:glycerol-3-phosphate dehydrogenase (NAD(P)+)
LVTRGLVEITRLGVAMGARPQTFAGLAGIGDLVTTCVSPSGRNRTAGEAIGRGASLTDVLAAKPSVIEGVPTTRSAMALAKRFNVEMPITAAVHAILFEGRDVRAALHDLMTRGLRGED